MGILLCKWDWCDESLSIRHLLCINWNRDCTQNWMGNNWWPLHITICFSEWGCNATELDMTGMWSYRHDELKIIRSGEFDHLMIRQGRRGWIFQPCYCWRGLNRLVSTACAAEMNVYQTAADNGQQQSTYFYLLLSEIQQLHRVLTSLTAILWE